MSALSPTYTVSFPTAIRRFALHFLEMCIVMCAGGAVLNIAVFGAAALLGHANLVAQAPELSILIITADLTLAMAGYMALRGHPVRHNVEMSGSTLVGGILLVGASWAEMLPVATLAGWPSLFAFMCGPLCLIMFVVMATRFEHYGGRVGTNAAIVKSSRTGEYTCSMHAEVLLAQPGQCPICGMRLTLRQPQRT
jgi:heavy metal-binding protein